ncbi:MAG TPA: hypothetical protein PLN17_03090 [Candidatus Cloacimonas sp.]|jgi:hypothetical protein|nr:hypothetical protein [Candidatus Cloacimonas sp.]HQJ96081.1 hypothetical protein [Candidatus Cloacimonas sp.]
MSKAKSAVRIISLWFIVIGLIYWLVWYVPILNAERKAKSFQAQVEQKQNEYNESGLNAFNGGWSTLIEMRDLKGEYYKFNNIASDRKKDKVHGILSAAVFLLGIIGLTVQTKL